MYCRCKQYIRISVFVQSKRVHLFIVNCVLKNKFNIHVIYYLWAKFSWKEYNLIKVYSKLVVIQAWQHWLQIMLCVCTKKECVKFTEFVCKTVRLAFSWQTSAISFPFIPIPCMYLIGELQCKEIKNIFTCSGVRNLIRSGTSNIVLV